MGGATFTPKQQNWKWYENNAAEPTVQLANENTKPTLANNTDKIRLRLCIAETGGKTANNVSISIEYSTDETNWYTLTSGNKFNYADGAATEGGTVTSYKLTDTSTYAEYVESDGGAATFDYLANASAEWDICIVPTATVDGGTTYYFRAKINTVEVPLNSGETHPQVLTATAATVIYPSTVSAIGTTYSPTVKYGWKITPSTISAVGTVYAATVVITGGATIITPSTISAVGTAYSPTVTGKSLYVASTISAVGTVYSPTVKYGWKVTPSTISVVGTVNAPIVTGKSLYTASTISVVGSVYSATVKTPTTITPSTISAVGTINAPTITGKSLYTASTISVVGSVYSATVITPIIITPSTISAVGTVNAPTITGKSLYTASTISTVGTTYSPTVTGKSLYTASTISTVGTTYSPTIQNIITPSTISAVGTINAPTIKYGMKVTPSTISVIGTVNAPTIKYGWKVTPSTISVIGTVNAPTVTGKSLYTASTISAVGTTYSPTVTGKSLFTASTISTVGTIHSPIVTGKSLYTASTISAVGTIYSPTVDICTLIKPSTISAVATVYHPVSLPPSSSAGMTPIDYYYDDTGRHPMFESPEQYWFEHSAYLGTANSKIALNYSSGFTDIDGYVYFASDAYVKWDEANNCFYIPKELRVGTSVLAGDAIELNEHGSGARNSYIDFHNADSPSDYTARIAHLSGNTNLYLTNNAGGNFTFNAALSITSGGLSITSGGLSAAAGDLTAGSTTRAANSYVRVLSNDAHIAGFEAYGSNQGTGYCYVGQSSQYGGGMFYNGDGNPAFATGETADYVSFYRTTVGVRHVVFDYTHNSSTVRFKSGFNIQGGSTIGKFTVSTSDASGGADNDLWLVRET